MEPKMDQNYNVLSDVLTFLEMNDELNTLKLRRESAQKGEFFVAFLGQFSAGKSYLINNLLGRDLLKSESRETTPLLTYIRYGEQERLVLHFDDGADKQLPVDEVKTITQQNNKWDYNKLTYMEVFVNSDLLREGMVLLDTPGINTVIERHEQLLSRSMELAAKIIYVSNNQPSQMDIEKIAALRMAGFSPWFVRTHCDEIKESEEKRDDVIARDYDILIQQGIVSEDCFHVSNYNDSSWFEGIESLRREMLCLGMNAQKEISIAMNEWEIHMASICLEILSQKKENLIACKAGNDNALQEKLNQVKNRVLSFEKMVTQRQNRLNEEISACQKQLLGPLRQELYSDLQNSSKRIEDSWVDIKSQEQMNQLVSSEIMHFACIANNKADSTISSLLHGIVEGENEEEFFIIDGAPEFERYSELIQDEDERIQELISKLSAIREKRTQLEKVLTERENAPILKEILDDLDELEKNIEEAQEQSDNLPPYEPQYVEKIDNRLQPSQIASAIGGALDWAFLFLPGTSITGAIRSAADSAKVVEKGARLLGKVEKVIETVDKGKDIAFTVKEIKSTINGLTKKSKRVYATKRRKIAVQKGLEKTADRLETGVKKLKKSDESFLDYLTIQHWTTEIGKKFDRLPQMEIDREYESAYQKERSRINQNLVDIQRQRYLKNLELGMYRNETERIEAESKAAVADEHYVEEQLSHKKQQLMRQAEENARKKWTSMCADWYLKAMNDQLNEFLKKHVESLPMRMSSYQERVLSYAKDNIQREQQEYQRLCNLPESDAEKELSCVEKFLDDLKDSYPEIVL